MNLKIKYNIYIVILSYKLFSLFIFRCWSSFGGGCGGGLLGWDTFLYKDDVDAVREIPSEFISGTHSLTSLGLGSLLYLKVNN